MSPKKKVSIVGGGMMGGLMAHELSQKRICEVVIQDRPEFGQHHAKALDIMQATASSSVLATDSWPDTSNSDVIVITAGGPTRNWQQDVAENAFIVSNIAKNIANYSPNAVIVYAASNPMGFMCHVVLTQTGFKSERVIGQGGMIASARFRAYLGEAVNASPRDVHGYVLGGHTNTTMVPIVSQARVGPIQITQLLPEEVISAIVERTKNSAAELLGLYRRGSSYFAPVAATLPLIEAILLDEQRVLPVHVLLDGQYGINKVFCCTLGKVGSHGVETIYEVDLSREELLQVKEGAAWLKTLLLSDALKTFSAK